MNENLLRNGGFEEDWSAEESHRCVVFPAGGEPYETDIGNIFTPPGWLAWFCHEEGVWAQPEVRDAWRSTDAVRVHGGEKATLLFTFGRKHHAGLMQQVQVTPGARVRLTAWAHAWSNHKDKKRPDEFPHPDDPRWSEGAGYGPFFAYEGDVDDDATRNFTFYLGVDATGGDDPFADTVAWGRGAHIYNEHHEVPTVEATVQGGTVTVFLRSVTLWPFKHSDAYWDDAALEVVEEPPPIPPDGRGKPRLQYARVYNVVPADATEEQAVAVFLEGWRRGRQTAGGSYDDAGVGDLDSRKANLYGVPRELRPEFQAFYDKYYPGVRVEFLPLPGDGPGPPGPVPPPAQDGPYIGPHCQTMVGGTVEYLEAFGRGLVKVFSLQDVLLVKRRVPDATVVYRWFTNHYGPYFALWPDRLAMGNLWIDNFRDSLAETAAALAAELGPEQARFYVEGGNELYPSLNAGQVQKAADFDVGVALALHDTGLNVGAAVFCAAVGNPHESEYSLLVELAQCCEWLGGLMGLHTYFPVDHGEGGPDALWRYLAGRWTEIDKVFVAEGIRVRWYGGESGACGGEWNGGVWLNPQAGWRHESAYGGDWNAYLAAIMRMDELNAQWNAEHGGRKLGDVLFTSGEPYVGWDEFKLEQKEWAALTEAMKDRY